MGDWVGRLFEFPPPPEPPAILPFNCGLPPAALEEGLEEAPLVTAEGAVAVVAILNQCSFARACN